MTRLRLDLNSRVARAWIAGAAAVSVASTSIISHAARLAQTPSTRTGAGITSGPGSLGALRSIRLDRSGRPPAETPALARQALSAWPLAFEPFFALALTRTGAKSGSAHAQAVALLREAVRRNPRARNARLALLQESIRTGDVSEAIDHLAVLFRLGSESADLLMQAFGRALTTTRQLDEAISALRPHQQLYKPFILSLRRADKSPQLMFHAVSKLPSSVLSDPQILEIAVQSMIEAQAFRQARSLWRTQNRIPEDAKGALVHSPDFRDLKSPPPFNWAFFSGPTGSAEPIQASGGASISYYGRVPGALIRQLLTLAPGRYEAVITYRTEGGVPGSIGLSVRCATSDARALTSAPLVARPGSPVTVRTSFSVPAKGCAGQYVALEGLPLVERSGQDIAVESLHIRGNMAL